MNNQVDMLHSKAMAIADDAFIAKRRGDTEQARQLSSEAFIYERDAALLLLNKFDIEPTRSVLFRSAGWLAFNAKEHEKAKVMVDYGLQGKPPFEIKTELEKLSYEVEELLAVEKMVANEKSDILNIHFNDGDAVNLGRINLGFFAPILNSYNEFRKAVSHDFFGSEQEIIASTNGSFNLFLKPIDKIEGEIFEDSSLEKRIADVLNYSNTIEGLKNLKLNEEELKKLKTFLRCINRKNASINFHFSSINNKIINYIIDKDKATVILDSINKLNYDNTFERKYEGVFIAIDLKVKTFKFLINNSDDLIYGKISNSVDAKIKEVFLSGFYQITILKHETKNAGEQENIKNLLIDIDERNALNHKIVSVKNDIDHQNFEQYALFTD